MYKDNQLCLHSAIIFATNKIRRHISVKYYCLNDLIKNGIFNSENIISTDQIADIFRKLQNVNALTMFVKKLLCRAY